MNWSRPLTSEHKADVVDPLSSLLSTAGRKLAKKQKILIWNWTITSICSFSRILYATSSLYYLIIYFASAKCITSISSHQIWWPWITNLESPPSGSRKLKAGVPFGVFPQVVDELNAVVVDVKRAFLLLICRGVGGGRRAKWGTPSNSAPLRLVAFAGRPLSLQK